MDFTKQQLIKIAKLHKLMLWIAGIQLLTAILNWFVSHYFIFVQIIILIIALINLIRLSRSLKKGIFQQIIIGTVGIIPLVYLILLVENHGAVVAVFKNYDIKMGFLGITKKDFEKLQLLP